jgi:threonine dehydratase
MPLEPGAGLEGRVIVSDRGLEFDLEPSDLGFGGPFYGSPEGMGSQLRAETDAQERTASSMDLAHVGRLSRHRLADVIPVDRPVRTQQHHCIEPCWIGPVLRMLSPPPQQSRTVDIDEMVAHDTRVAITLVADHQHIHTTTVGHGMDVHPPSDDDIDRARRAGRGIVKHTPIVTSTTLSARAGGQVVIKAENLQRTGSFKIRGAMAKLDRLEHLAAAGVTAGSAGNHAQALAHAARTFRVPCEIFVPAGAPIAKVEACRSYGATVVEGGASLVEAVAAAQARAEEAGLAFCHPYDDAAVVAGQATLGCELVEDLTDVDQVVIPLGGGGLAAGTAAVLRRSLPSVRIIGVQVAACAPYTGAPVPDGPVATLADGIAVKRPGAITAPLIHSLLDDIVTVEEDLVADAMMLLLERTKLVVEGAGAVGVSALLGDAVRTPKGTLTCVVLSGGNVDLGMLPSLISRHETRSGRRLVLYVRIPDRPGGLATLLTAFAATGSNLISVEHVREGVDLHVRETGVQIALEVRDRQHGEHVIAAARSLGCATTEVTGYQDDT